MVDIVRGNELLDEGEYESALVEFERALAADGDCVPALIGRGWCHLRLGRMHAALGDFNLACKLQPDNNDAKFARGTLALEYNDPREAIAYFDEILKRDRKHVWAWGNRGNAYCELGDLKTALGCFDEVIHLEPKDAFAFFNRGNTHQRLGSHSRAVADFDRAEALDYDGMQLYINRADSYDALGELERAVDDLTRATRLEIAPKEMADVLRRRARIYERMGRKDLVMADRASIVKLVGAEWLAWEERREHCAEDGSEAADADKLTVEMIRSRATSPEEVLTLDHNFLCLGSYLNEFVAALRNVGVRVPDDVQGDLDDWVTVDCTDSVKVSDLHTRILEIRGICAEFAEVVEYDGWGASV